MAKNFFDHVVKFDPITGKSLKSKRKNFTAATKRGALIKCKGKCMECKKGLHERSTEYDHKDNNPSNNKPSNCWIVCSNWHRQHTVIAKRKIKDMFGNVIGHKTIKKKVTKKKSSTEYELVVDPWTGKKKKVKKPKSFF